MELHTYVISLIISAEIHDEIILKTWELAWKVHILAMRWATKFVCLLKKLIIEFVKLENKILNLFKMKKKLEWPFDDLLKASTVILLSSMKITF